MSFKHTHDATSGRAGRSRRRWLPWLVLGVALVLVLGTGLLVPAWLRSVTRQAPSSLAVGGRHSCLLTRTGEVRCWGGNDRGQLGDATTLPRTGPVVVAGLTGIVSVVSGGGDHTCALTAAGTVACWGHNDHGQLGDGSTESSSIPVTVTGLTGVVGIAVGRLHSCAALASGAVRCWGGNGLGELGDGSETDSPTPVDVLDLPLPMNAVTALTSSTCAVTERGRVRCWGDNSDGQLGTGDTNSTLVPVAAVGLGPRVARAAAGDTHSCAVTLQGGVVCWGANDVGQLGTGSNTSSLTAVAVSGLDSGVGSVSAGRDRTCAIRAGAVLCWGATGAPGEAPVQPMPAVVLPAGAASVEVGPTHACALTDAGGVRCWGGNYVGQLGDGTTRDSDTPVDVVGL